MPPPETVLVTGASSGIGRALAHRFARAGYDCVLLARSNAPLHDLADTLETTYDADAPVLPADLSKPGAAEDIAANLTDRDLAVNVLVNNAGVGAQGRFTEIDAQQQVDMIQVNVTALTHLTRRLLPGMLKRDRGGVLNVASTAAFQPGPYMSVYYATKAYVLSFSEGLAHEARNTNVTVTCLAPGPTDTAFMARADMHGTALFETASHMTPEDVADTGYEAFQNDRTLVVPGWPNKIGTFLVRFTPRPLARRVAGWLNS
ncbi:MAG: SDR family NAD(P)-dependent oxidoreductase [Salinibacter sp.]